MNYAKTLIAPPFSQALYEPWIRPMPWWACLAAVYFQQLAFWSPNTSNDALSCSVILCVTRATGRALHGRGAQRHCSRHVCCASVQDKPFDLLGKGPLFSSFSMGFLQHQGVFCTQKCFSSQLVHMKLGRTWRCAYSERIPKWQQLFWIYKFPASEPRAEVIECRASIPAPGLKA